MNRRLVVKGTIGTLMAAASSRMLPTLAHNDEVKIDERDTFDERGVHFTATWFENTLGTVRYMFTANFSRLHGSLVPTFTQTIILSKTYTEKEVQESEWKMAFGDFQELAYNKYRRGDLN